MKRSGSWFASIRTLAVAFIAIVTATMLNFCVQKAAAQSTTNDDEESVIHKIRREGLDHSQVNETLSYLSDVIGQRLTGSPSLRRANEWTRKKLEGWGLANAHLEAWGPFGRGWELKHFSAQITEPYDIPLIAWPNAWSPGCDKPLTAEVVYVPSITNSDKYKGKLAGAIVLAGEPRELQPRFAPLATRMAETNLLKLANAAAEEGGEGRRGGRGGRLSGPGGATRLLSFLAKENVALVVRESSIGDGGSVFVAAASVPGAPARGEAGPTNFPRAWSTNAPTIPPQITVAAEDYNRLARMMQQGEKLKMEVDLRARFYSDDPMAYNTIAEIPGGDLKNEIVMLGAHLDSWHSGTGATDNGAGVACVMEAARILSTLNLHPRRTIRIALWTGEEQGILGSKAYVTEHFGYYTNLDSSAPRAKAAARADKEKEKGKADAEADSQSPPKRKLVPGREYDKLSAYFNLDNGAGKIRGVYLQNNEAVRPIFRAWLEPFRDLGAETLTISNTGSTDHIPFDAIGLPGFQFIQDPLDYSTRSHHSNQDVFDRIIPEDLKQASTILAAFAYDAAMAEAKLPRKAVE